MIPNLSNRIQTLQDQYNSANNLLMIKIGEKKSLINEKKILETKKSELENELIELQKQKLVLNKTSEVSRDYAKKKLENIMTQSIQYVFGPNYSIEIELGVKGNKPTADFLVVTKYPNGNVVKLLPEERKGGGVVDILSIACKMAVLQLHSPKIGGFAAWDEPGKMVSDGLINQLGELMKFISKKFNRQIIYVTHHEEMKYISNKAYKVQLIDGVSNVTEIKEVEQ